MGEMNFRLATLLFSCLTILPLWSFGQESGKIKPGTSDFDEAEPSGTENQSKDAAPPEAAPTSKTSPATAPANKPPEAIIDHQADQAKLEIREAIQKRDIPAVNRLIGKAATKYPKDTELRTAYDYVKLHLHDAKAKSMIAMMQMDGQKLFGHQWIPGRIMSDDMWDVSLEAYGQGTKAFRSASAAAVQQTLVKSYALLDRGQAVQAEKLLTGALQRQGEAAELYYARVMARGMERNFNGADADSLRAVTLSGQNAVALSQRARLMKTMGRREEAFTWAERALKSNPTDADALLIRGMYQWRDRRNPELALVDLKKAAEIDPDEYRNTYREGLRRLNMQRAVNNLIKGDYKQALEDADNILKLDPANPDAHAVRGQVFLKAGRVEDTVKETTLALKADPKCENALLYRSIAMETLGARPAALADMKRAAALNPKYKKLYDDLLQAQRQGIGPLWERKAAINLAQKSRG
jgi:tetratricopeptide (TPR) repeat protein